jgi:hypothetical protein
MKLTAKKIWILTSIRTADFESITLWFGNFYNIFLKIVSYVSHGSGELKMLFRFWLSLSISLLFAELISEAVDIFWKEEKEVPFKDKLDRFNRSASHIYCIC